MKQVFMSLLQMKTAVNMWYLIKPLRRNESLERRHLAKIAL